MGRRPAAAGRQETPGAYLAPCDKHTGCSASKGCCMCCVPDEALKHIGPGEALPAKKSAAGDDAGKPAAPGGAHGYHHNGHTHQTLREEIKCISACAVRCIHDHMPGHQKRAPPKMREEDAKKWLIAKRKDFARYR